MSNPSVEHGDNRMSNPMSDIHPNGNGGSHVPSADVIRALDKLEIKVKLLRLQPEDVILIQYSSQPSMSEIVDLQHNIQHMMDHLKLDFRVFYMLVPPGLELTQLDPLEMEKLGWVRKENAP